MRRLVAGLVAALLTLSACATAGSSPAGGSDTLSQVKERGVINMGIANENPFAYFDADGNLHGIDADIMAECIRRLNLPPLQGVQNTFDGLIAGLQAGRTDMVGAGLGWRQARADVVTPSNPTYTILETAVVPTGNPDHIASWDDIANGTMKVGSVQGSMEYIQSQKKIGDRMVGYQNQAELMADLQAGRIGAAINPDVINKDYLEKNPNSGLEIADGFVFPPRNQVVLFFNKEHGASLKDAINGCLTQLKSDGTLLKILETYKMSADNIIPDGTQFKEPGF